MERARCDMILDKRRKTGLDARCKICRREEHRKKKASVPTKAARPPAAHVLVSGASDGSAQVLAAAPGCTNYNRCTR